jgi:hypothetical protein
MPEVISTPEENEGELYTELQRAVLTKNYDRIIALAQQLEDRQRNPSFSDRLSEQPQPTELRSDKQTTDRYLKFAATGLAEFTENERPVFLQLDIDAPSSLGDSRRVLVSSSSKQSSYLLFLIDSNTGYLYPNPKISFSESMKYIWPSLNYNNWPGQMASQISPVKVTKIRDGVWITEGNVM